MSVQLLVEMLPSLLMKLSPGNFAMRGLSMRVFFTSKDVIFVDVFVADQLFFLFCLKH